MEIREKTEPDPVAALYIVDVYMVDAYIRWALLAIKEVPGHGRAGLLVGDRQNTSCRLGEC